MENDERRPRVRRAVRKLNELSTLGAYNRDYPRVGNRADDSRECSWRLRFSHGSVLMAFVVALDTGLT